MSPLPTSSWRSRFEPSGVFESFVEDSQPLEPHPSIEVVDCRFERASVRDVDTRRPPVARIEAEAETRVSTEGVGQRGELGDRAADRAAGAGCVLHAEPELVGGQLEELRTAGTTTSTASSKP